MIRDKQEFIQSNEGFTYINRTSEGKITSKLLPFTPPIEMTKLGKALIRAT